MIKSPKPEIEQSKELFIVIAYDVVEDRRRNRVFKALKNHGRHVQYSVFECELRPDVFQTLQKKLASLIDPREDNLRFYFLDEDQVRRIQSIGREHPLAGQRTNKFLII